MSRSSYANINDRLKSHHSQGKNFHYIDVEKALNNRVDEIFEDEDLYQAFSDLSPDEKTPDLKNLENLKFPLLRKAMIIAEIMIGGSEKNKGIIKSLYSKEVISQSIAFADENLDKKLRRENADKVHKATQVFEPGDEFLYDKDENARFIPYSLRR